MYDKKKNMETKKKYISETRFNLSLIAYLHNYFHKIRLLKSGLVFTLGFFLLIKLIHFGFNYWFGIVGLRGNCL